MAVTESASAFAWHFANETSSWEFPSCAQWCGNSTQSTDSEASLLMQRAAVVCTTLTGVLMRDLRDLRFDVAVVDEAAQVNSFLPLCYLCTCMFLPFMLVTWHLGIF